MPKTSAGILLYRTKHGYLEFMLVHPGGPIYANRDLQWWSIPKGELDGNGEDMLAAAKREFEEETGHPAGEGEFIELKPQTMKSGKRLVAWALEGDFDVTHIHSNTFELEWPPKSGNLQQFPEVDRAGWFTTNVALEKIHPAQRPFVEEVVARVGG